MQRNQFMDSFNSENCTTISLLDLLKEYGKELEAFCGSTDGHLMDHDTIKDVEVCPHSTLLPCSTSSKATHVANSCVSKEKNNRGCCARKTECRILQQSLDQLDKALTTKNDYLMQDIKSLSKDLDAFTQAIAHKDPTEHLEGGERFIAGADSIRETRKETRQEAHILDKVSHRSVSREHRKSAQKQSPDISIRRTTKHKMKHSGRLTTDKDSPHSQEPPHEKEPLLTSLVVWRKYQDAGFERHIRRQLQARATEVRGRGEMGRKNVKQLPKSRVKNEVENASSTSSTVSSHSISSPCTKIRPLMPNNVFHTYLERYTTDRKLQKQHARPHAHKSHSDAIELSRDKKQTHRERSVLVYRYDSLYQHEVHAAAYIVCKSLKDLTAKIQIRLGVPDVANLYRDITRDRKLQEDEKAVPLWIPPKRLQRISQFQQLQESDHIYVTQNPREDIAILCSWLRLRQRRQKQLEAAMRLGSKSKNENVSVGSKQHSWSKQEAKQLAALILDQNRDMSISYACSLYDAQGRKVAIKKRYPA